MKTEAYFEQVSKRVASKIVQYNKRNICDWSHLLNVNVVVIQCINQPIHCCCITQFSSFNSVKVNK